MITITGPIAKNNQLFYALSVLFDEFLGLKWRYKTSSKQNGTLSIQAHGYDTEIILPFIFLPLADDADAVRALTASDHVQQLRVDKAILPPTLTHNVIPVLFQKNKPTFQITDSTTFLPIDIVGTAFFMLSNFEETLIRQKDDHGRLSAQSSLAYQHGYLHRPLIDEYIEILWQCMRRLWPDIKRKSETEQITITCDIDRPYELGHRTKDILYGMKSDLRLNFNLPLYLKTIQKRLRYRLGNFNNDQFLANIDRMMAIAKSHQQMITFYMLAGGSHPLDGFYHLNEPIIQALCQKIHKNGHRLGIHGSYLSHNNPQIFGKQLTDLRTCLTDLDIPASEIIARQHYLRWDHLVTPHMLDELGIASDSSLAYADHAGFRCGTSREYPMYDLLNQQVLSLRQRPLIMMETSIFGQRYQNMPQNQDTLDYMMRLKATALRLGKNFTFLWHNCSFEDEESFTFFDRLVQP